MAEPIISVIMGTYNPTMKHLKEAVNSIITQTLREWELILIDDGSEINIFKEVKKIQETDNRIRIIRNSKNRGLAFALNQGLKQARGKYIARMDDDDISLPSRFKEQVKFLENNLDYGWVGCNADLFDDEGVWGMASRPEKPVKSSFLNSSPFIHPSVMFRKEVLLESGGYSLSRFASRCEDYELFMRLYANGKKGYNIKSILFQYRDDSRQLKRSMKYSYYEMRIRIDGFSKMGILSLRTVPYLLKPILVRIAALCPSLAQKIRTNRSTGDHRIATNK